MLIPYASTTTIFHWPVVTMALIVINVLVYAVGGREAVEAGALLFGEGLHPLTWLTSAFLHADVLHLLGNMVFLWCFGVIVEGRLGHVPFFAAYVVLAMGESATTQILMQHDTGAAIGASGAIFGLLAMATLWAPRDKIKSVLILYYRYFLLEISVWVFVALYLVLQLVLASLSGFAMSSALLHLFGAAWGFALGLFVLKYNFARFGAGALVDRLVQRARARQRERLFAEISGTPSPTALTTRRTQPSSRSTPLDEDAEPQFLRTHPGAAAQDTTDRCPQSQDDI